MADEEINFVRPYAQAQMSEGPENKESETGDNTLQDLILALGDVKKTIETLSGSLLDQQKLILEAQQEKQAHPKKVDESPDEYHRKNKESMKQGFAEALAGLAVGAVAFHQPHLDRQFEEHHSNIARQLVTTLGVQSAMGGNMVQDAFHAIGDVGNLIQNTLGTAISSVIPAFQGLVGTLGSVTASFIGVVGALAFLDGLMLEHQDINFRKQLMRAAPGSYGQIMPHEFLPHMLQDIKHHSIGGMSDEDAQKLYMAAAGTRPFGATPEQTKQQAWLYGVLDNYGMSPDESRGISTRMQREFKLSFQESGFQMAQLADTAKTHGLSLSSYMTQILELTKGVRGLGYSLADTNAMFKRFRDSTYNNGISITDEGAMEATRLSENIQRGLPIGDAAYIAMTTGSNLTALNSGIAGGPQGLGGETFGSFAGRNSFNAYIAAQLMKVGNVPGFGGAFARHVEDIVEPFVRGAAPRNAAQRQSIQGVMIGGELNREGVQGVYGVDQGFTALVSSIQDGSFNRKTAKEMSDELKKFMPKTLDDYFGIIDKDFSSLLDGDWKNLQKITQPLAGLEDVLTKIRDLFAGITIPLIQGMTLLLAQIGAGLAAFFTKSGGNWQAAAGAYVATGEELKNSFAQLDSDGSLKSVLNQNILKYFGIIASDLQQAPLIASIKSTYTDEHGKVNQYGFQMPETLDKMSSGFGWRTMKDKNGNPIQEFHPGIDFAVPIGTPVHSAEEGVVTTAGYVRGFGHAVYVRHPGGFQTIYGHLSKVGVKVGQHIEGGEIVGLSGNEGRSTGPHFHFETDMLGRDNKYYGVDPKWFDQKAYHGIFTKNRARQEELIKQYTDELHRERIRFPISKSPTTESGHTITIRNDVYIHPASGQTKRIKSTSTTKQLTSGASSSGH